MAHTATRRAFRAAPPRPRVSRRLAGVEVILLVEDDATLRAFVRDGLESYGYVVLPAANGAEALRYLRMLSAPPDLLLTDLLMPQLSGRELIETLEREGKLPKVLMMAGYAGGVRRRTQRAAKYPLLRKPFTHVELASKVRAVLDG